MSICKFVKRTLRKLDIFGSSQFLRYKEEPRFGSLTGGIATIILIVLFAILFWNQFIHTIQKQNITADDSLAKEANPSPLSVGLNDTYFIFGVGIQGVNLSQNVRYFDFTLQAQTYSTNSSSIIYPMEPCKHSSWNQTDTSDNPVGSSSYHRAGLNGFLCPPENFMLELQGKFTSDIFQFVRLTVSQCNPALNLTSRCATQDQLTQLGSYYGGTFTLNFYFMNAVVNSKNINPISYYFQDRNYMVFDCNHTMQNNIFIAQHTIQTDNSLFPNQDITNQTVILITDNQMKDILVSPVVSQTYVKIFLRKSPSVLTSIVSYEKYDGFFSYIGGLFGFAMVACLVISFYDEAAFQIQMGSNLFYYEEKQPLRSQIYNFFLFLFSLPYIFLQKIGINLPCKMMKQYDECREEIGQQLDVVLLINKITYLQKSMNILFEDHQFRSIYLQHKPTIKEAQQHRLNHGLNKIIHKNYKEASQRIRKMASLPSEPQITTPITPKNIQQGNKKMTESEQINKDYAALFLNDLFFPNKNQAQGNKNQAQLRSECVNIGEMESQPIQFGQIINALYKNAIRKETESQKSVHNEKMTNQNLMEKQKGGSVLSNIQQNQQNQQNPNTEFSLKFITAAANDLKLIQKQAKNGNRLSKKIYQKLDTQITKDQFNIFNEILIMGTELGKVTSKRLASTDDKKKSHSNDKPESKKKTLIQIPIQSKQTIQALQIVLQTNNRIMSNQTL